ncbi:DUF1702 family protein [bacterium]|nr:DUF1702 family protein [bacterium]
MISMRGRLRRRLFGIHSREVTFQVRGFPAAAEAKRECLERVGREFLGGYHAAMEEDGVPALSRRLDVLPPEFRGFAYEGAAMALALRGATGFGRVARLREFLEGPADAHVYTAHVGVGWAAARLPALLRPRRLDPLLRWLVFDGMGFHDGYFHPRRVIAGGRVPAALRGYERRAFDQGVGRCLWFYAGSDPDRAADVVNTFEASRRDDLWGGIGIACAYAGNVSGEELGRLRARADGHAVSLAQGVAFGVKAHARAGHAAESAALASRVICGVEPETAAAWCDEGLAGLRDGDEDADRGTPAYEKWRAAVRRIAAATGALPVSLPEGSRP